MTRMFGHLLFGILAAFVALFTGEIAVGVFQSVGTPHVSFGYTEEGFVHPVGLEVWGADHRGLSGWDQIVAVDGELVFSGSMIRQQAFGGPIPRDVTYQVRTLDGHDRFVVVPTRIFSASDLLRSHAVLAVLGLAFVVIAILLYVLRPGTAEAWGFFSFFSLIGVCMSGVVDENMLWKFPPMFGIFAPYLPLAGLINVAALAGAFRETPTGDAAGVVLKRTMWLVLLGALVTSSVIALVFVSVRGDVHHSILVGDFLFAWLAIGTGIGLFALFVAYQRGKSPTRRARLRQVLWAIPLGAGIPSINLMVAHVYELSSVSFLWNGFVLILPLATADAIVRHDLLKLNATARRLVGGMTVAALMGMGLGFALWAAANFLSITDAAGTVALAALLFAMAAPINHRVQAYVESLLRSRRYDAGRILADFTTKSSTATHLTRVTAVLSEALSSSIAPKHFELYALDSHGQQLVPKLRDDPPVDISADISSLLGRSEPAIFDDEQPGPDAFHNCALALRLAVANEPVGLLTLGPRTDDLAYDGSDVAFIESLAGPLAASLVNTRAYEAVEALNQALEARVIERTAELEEKNHELNLLNVRKDELVATVSHDFRSPLAIIRQNVQTILRDLHRMEPDDIRDFLEGVGRQEQRLTSMCESLLDLAKLKQQRTFSDEIAVAELAASIVEDFRFKAEQADLRLVCEHTDEDLSVLGNEERLSQILQNLVDNALKFTPAGGEVTVSIRRATSADEDVVVVEVHDTGLGVPQDLLPRLFEPFFQVPRQSHVGQGSGLGLAIVKAVVDAHGGTVSVRSDDDGTVFRITLPAARQDRPATDAPQATQSDAPRATQTESAALPQTRVDVSDQPR